MLHIAPCPAGPLLPPLCSKKHHRHIPHVAARQSPLRDTYDISAFIRLKGGSIPVPTLEAVWVSA